MQRNIVYDAGLASALIEERVISDLHNDEVKSKSTSYNKAQELLNIIRRRSIRQCNLFVKCLREHGYPDAGN